MNISLTPEEYRKLIELAYLGEWMINAHHEPEIQDDDASAIVQKLLAAGPSDDAERDDETGSYYMNTTWTDTLYDRYIYDYDDHVFWDELTERLAARDLAHGRGVDADSINRDDDLLELRPLEDRYQHELEEHGIERLEINQDYSL